MSNPWAFGRTQLLTIISFIITVSLSQGSKLQGSGQNDRDYDVVRAAEASKPKK
jgi:hypothetical protein